MAVNFSPVFTHLPDIPARFSVDQPTVHNAHYTQSEQNIYTQLKMDLNTCSTPPGWDLSDIHPLYGKPLPPDLYCSEILEDDYVGYLNLEGATSKSP